MPLPFTAHGKTVTRPHRPHEVDDARQPIANYRRFQALTAELVEVSEQLCRGRRAQPGSRSGSSGR